MRPNVTVELHVAQVMSRKSKNIFSLRKWETLLMWQVVIVLRGPQRQKLDLWIWRYVRSWTLFRGTEGHCQAHISIYSICVCGCVCICLCACSYTKASKCYLCQKFYEAGQTQGVIVIYEAPRCLWRVQSDQKYTVPSPVHSVSTECHLIRFIECVQNIIQDLNRQLCSFRMGVTSIRGGMILLCCAKGEIP